MSDKIIRRTLCEI